MSNRKEVTEWFIKNIAELQPKNQNIKMYQDYFDALSDAAFAELMVKLKEGKITMPFYSPNLSSKDVDIKKALKVADELGLDFFQQLWLTDNATGVKYLTPEKYFIVHMAIRRQIQHVAKGLSVTEHSNYVDTLTGQPVSDSKSSKLSLPEIINLDTLGLHKSIEEMISVRGGNTLGYSAAKQDTINTGTYTLQAIEDIGSRPTSIDTLRAFLLGSHLDSTL